MTTPDFQPRSAAANCARCLRLRRRVFALLGALLLAVPASAQNDAPAPQPATTPAVSTAPASPAAPVASQPAPLLPKPVDQGPACGAGACCCQVPLAQVDDAAYRLPTGSTEKTYRHTLSGRGGTPPYGYAIANGRLQRGLTLNEDGTITGQPSEAGTRAFDVQMHDGSGASVLQTYTLTVIRPKAAGPAKPTAPPAPTPPPPLKQLSLADARAPAALDATVAVSVYRLLPETLALLKPSPAVLLPDYLLDETAVDAGGSVAPAPKPAEAAAPPAAAQEAAGAEPPPAPDIVDDAQALQLKAMLQPLLNVEYPNRHLFTAALDAALCRYTRQLTLDAAKKTHTRAPSNEEFGAVCPVDWAKPPKATSADGEAVRWQDLPTTLLPPTLRDWLIERALQRHPLLPWQPLQWDGNGCGCVLSDLDGEIYGFYPLWWANGKPQVIDFSLFRRLSYFALPIGDDGGLQRPELKKPGVVDFIETAHRHRTAIDLTLYRNDWAFLATQTDPEREVMVDQLAQQARQIIDTPLPGWRASARAALPLFGETEYVADGLTLYLDNLPDSSASPDTRAKLRHLVERLIDRLITELRQGPRDYALNLVMQDQQLIDDDGLWRVKQLAEVLYAAENPQIIDRRIDGDSVEYHSNTNITVRFLVLLSEPSSETKKQLRQVIENSPLLRGGNRRVFLRKIIPVVATGVSDLRQFSDDMAYFNDNFGGVAFWPVPIAGETATANHLDSVEANFHLHAPGVSLRGEQLCGWVCAHRWPLRVVFELLILIGIVSIGAYAASCRVRQLGKKYRAFVMLGAVPTLALGALLLRCDPQLLSLRTSHWPLWILLASLLITALVTLLQPRIEKP